MHRDTFIWVHSIYINQHDDIKNGPPIKTMGANFACINSVFPLAGVGMGTAGGCKYRPGTMSMLRSPRTPKRTGCPWKPRRKTELRMFVAFLNPGTNRSQLAEIRQVWELSNYGSHDKALHEKISFHPGPTETWAAIDLLLHLAGFRKAWIARGENFVLVVDFEVLLWNPGPLGCAVLAGKQMVFHQVMQLVNKASPPSCKSDIGIDVSDADVALGWQMVPHFASLQYLAGVNRHKTGSDAISSMNKVAADSVFTKITQHHKHILDPGPIIQSVRACHQSHALLRGHIKPRKTKSTHRLLCLDRWQTQSLW